MGKGGGGREVWKGEGDGETEGMERGGRETGEREGEMGRYRE